MFLDFPNFYLNLTLIPLTFKYTNDEQIKGYRVAALKGFNFANNRKHIFSFIKQKLTTVRI